MIILFLLLLLFGVLHSLLADLRVKNWVSQKLGNTFRFYRIAYNLLFLSLLGAIIYVLFFVLKPVYVLPKNELLHFSAIAVTVMGVILMVVSFASFDMAEFIGFSYLRKQEQKQEKLRIGGFYKYVRHPLYFALFVLFAGLFLLQPTQMNLMTVAFLYFYTYIGATLEEKKLEQIFGTDYVNYKQQVKMLIPFIF